MQEKTIKAGLLAIGILLVTSGYKLADISKTIHALIVIAVGVILIVASQYIHVEQVEITDINRRLYEVEGTVKELGKDMLEEKHN